MALISLLAVSAIIFWCVELLPGDAASASSAATRRRSPWRCCAAASQPLRGRARHAGSALLSGDLGRPSSLTVVLDYISSRIANTALLSGFALLLYIPVSIALGVITAIYRGKMIDHAISAVVIVFMCLPEFVIGILLISIFAIKLAWLPPLALIGQAQISGN